VVAQEDTTICVPQGFSGAVDAYGNILLSLDHVPIGQ
jgi:N-methylhydantoinase A